VLVLMMPYVYLVPWWIVRRDMRRLPPHRLARCWNSASLGAAIVAFVPLCLLVHFIKAHGWLKGSALGVAWTFAWLAGALLLPELLVRALGAAPR